MNVLLTALSSVQTLIPNQEVELLKEENFKNESGFAIRNIVRLKLVAQIQPAKEQELKELAEGVLGVDSTYKFYLLGDLVEVLNFISNEQCFISWKNNIYKVYQKMDYSGNGWIKILAVLYCTYNDFEKGLNDV
ncbi:hypothetical protein [Helicobacter sp. MIT 05-5294]|uniref:hypothetical protein n=1 Tax=Helicobacter sp. MIT 05-5294 TaxID=1548150 RepID=UPI0010FD76B5|nr:hypothetical protein [Helicobacter sp. MIT 05-5294]TLD85793.1 hypothetical protein LS69_007815 [Helicobacter sp. MIT 05-5294]